MTSARGIGHCFVADALTKGTRPIVGSSIEEVCEQATYEWDLPVSLLDVDSWEREYRRPAQMDRRWSTGGKSDKPIFIYEVSLVEGTVHLECPECDWPQQSK